MQRIETMFDRKNYKYIYSVNFANYLMTQGIMCRGTGISPMIVSNEGAD